VGLTRGWRGLACHVSMIKWWMNSFESVSQSSSAKLTKDFKVIKKIKKLRKNLIKMQTKTISKQLYDALLDYLIQSSTALDDTARALAPDPLQAARVDVLNDSLDLARVLLSKVIFHILIHLLSDFFSGLLQWQKSRGSYCWIYGRDDEIPLLAHPAFLHLSSCYDR
jgi:hypothetical protein